MSFLQQIQQFSKCSLKHTDTLVTTAAGQKLLEQHDSSGRVTVTNTETATLGFVGDYKPDFQVGTILPGLLISSQDVAADLSLLKQYHVTHILNLSPQCAAQFPDHFTYKCLGLLDLPSQSLRPVIQDCLAFIKLAVECGDCVLVHCNAGVSRSAAIVIAYLMYSQHLNYQQAFDLVKSKRPAIRPNDGFVAELKQLQDDLFTKSLAKI